MACRCAPALTIYRDEINALFPDRDKASDGCCGDAAHAARRSDHNPATTGAGVGYAHAFDLDEDLVAGWGDRQLWHMGILLLSDPRTKYVIYEARILYPDGTDNPYSGINAHRSHLHLSIKPTATFNTAPWFLARAFETPEPPEEAMPPAPAIVDVDGLRFVFVRGTDGHLWMLDPNGGQHDYGGVLTSGPSAVVHATDPETIEVATRGQDGATWVITVSPSTAKVVADWASIGGQS